MVLQNSETIKQNSGRIIVWNKWLGVAHFVQGCVILLLSSTRTIPISTSYQAVDPLQTANVGHTVFATATRHIFDLNLAAIIAEFFFISAAAHFFVATVYKKQYLNGIKQGSNRARWIDYSLSTSVMLVAIGVLSGIYDLSTLVLVFVLEMVASLLGLAMEMYNKGKREPNWLAFVISCIAAIAPWIALALYAWGAGVYGGHMPGFVYGILTSIFVLFACIAGNTYLQYKKRSHWANYLFSEKVYMILNLATKTVLAWQIFAGALRP
ncbi:MAG TPA: heliorhodopsin HeR [Candidatus Saccharimonadales bacterium]|nr:heliorhodopsin HeR [Candidatus Saccharimonadales bacterium]